MNNPTFNDAAAECIKTLERYYVANESDIERFQESMQRIKRARSETTMGKQQQPKVIILRTEKEDIVIPLVPKKGES